MLHPIIPSMFTFENIKHNMKTFRKIGCLLLIATFSFPCFAKKRIPAAGHDGYRPSFWPSGQRDTAPKSIIPKRPIQA